LLNLECWAASSKHAIETEESVCREFVLLAMM